MTTASSSITSSDDQVQSICELFRCCICMCDVNDARICPKCAKLCCYSCIRRWITERQAQCPHCRTPLALTDLVKANWVEEVTQRLDRLKLLPVTDIELCPTHQEKLSVFCTKCHLCICHHCALWGGKEHEGHDLVPVVEECKKRLVILEAALPSLKTRFNMCKTAKKGLESDMETITNNREKVERELQSVFNEMLSRLDYQMNTKLHSLSEDRRLLSTEMKVIVELTDEIERHSLLPGAALLRNFDSLHEAVNEACRSGDALPPCEMITEFVSELVPVFQTSTFVLRPFSNLRRSSEPVYSPPLVVNGLTWRLKVYPNGNGQVREHYVSVFLELSQGSSQKHRYDYRIEYKCGRESVTREYSSDFDVGECWGYNCFCETASVERQAVMDKDSVTFEFSVRPHTYQQKCRDLEWYIDQLKHDNAVSNAPLLIELDEPARLVGKESKTTERRRRRRSPDRLPQEDTPDFDQSERDVDLHAMINRSTTTFTSPRTMESDDGTNVLVPDRLDATAWRDTLGRIESTFRAAMAAAELDDQFTWTGEGEGEGSRQRSRPSR